MNDKLKLIIFDLDGTLTYFKDTRFPPGVIEFFEYVKDKPVQIAIATNQGAVGLRRWMQLHNFPSDPDEFESAMRRYPPQSEVDARIAEITEELSEICGKEIKVYTCYRYQSQSSGKWSPVPPEGYYQDESGHMQVKNEWRKEWRKPDIGMLLKAIKDSGLILYDSDDVLYVGDRESDKEAASVAGISYQDHDDFFKNYRPRLVMYYTKSAFLGALPESARKGLDLDKTERTFVEEMRTEVGRYQWYNGLIPKRLDTEELTIYFETIEGKPVDYLLYEDYQNLTNDYSWLRYESAKRHIDAVYYLFPRHKHLLWKLHEIYPEVTQDEVSAMLHLKEVEQETLSRPANPLADVYTILYDLGYSKGGAENLLRSVGFNNAFDDPDNCGTAYYAKMERWALNYRDGIQLLSRNPQWRIQE